jgi:hypothetical protein
MHYRSFVSVFVFSLSFLFSSALVSRADECADILQQGIYDQYRISSKQEYQAKVKEFFSKSWDQLKQKHSSSHGGGGFDFLISSASMAKAAVRKINSISSSPALKPAVMIFLARPIISNSKRKSSIGVSWTHGQTAKAERR